MTFINIISVQFVLKFTGSVKQLPLLRVLEQRSATSGTCVKAGTALYDQRPSVHGIAHTHACTHARTVRQSKIKCFAQKS